MEKVAVLGASKKEDRYSNKAVKLLLEHKHTVYPVHPLEKIILGQKVYSSIVTLPQDIDTLTIYLNPKHIEKELENILTIHPKRVIFNPGSESELVMARLKSEGITVVKGCTLLMLKTGQY